jgi:UDP-galactopyranose mutase
MKHSVDLLVVGAGFAGAVLAERFARILGKRSLVIDRRPHIAGNSYDGFDAAGVLIHRYGPHYFRTNSDRVRAYLSQFTEWQPVEYTILSYSDGRFWNFPINLNTFEQFVGHSATSEEMTAVLAKWRVPIDQPKNSEEVIISQVGYELYAKFFRHYTRNQWHRDPSELDASVCARIPIRTNRDNRYLTEKFQALPKDGYTPLIHRILDHPNRPTIAGHHHSARVSRRFWTRQGTLLSYPGAGREGVIFTVRGTRRRRAQRQFCRTAGNLPVLQYGSGGPHGVNGI